MRISDWSSDVCSSDLRCRYIDRRISNIDGLGPFGLRNCGEQREWIGFWNRQCVATDNSVEHTSPAERFDQMVSTSLRLIGANREPEALAPQPLVPQFQSRLGCRKTSNIVGLGFPEYRNGPGHPFLTA